MNKRYMATCGHQVVMESDDLEDIFSHFSASWDDRPVEVVVWDTAGISAMQVEAVLFHDGNQPKIICRLALKCPGKYSLETNTLNRGETNMQEEYDPLELVCYCGQILARQEVENQLRQQGYSTQAIARFHQRAESPPLAALNPACFASDEIIQGKRGGMYRLTRTGQKKYLSSEEMAAHQARQNSDQNFGTQLRKAYQDLQFHYITKPLLPEQKGHKVEDLWTAMKERIPGLSPEDFREGLVRAYRWGVPGGGGPQLHTRDEPEAARYPSYHQNEEQGGGLMRPERDQDEATRVVPRRPDGQRLLHVTWLEKHPVRDEDAYRKGATAKITSRDAMAASRNAREATWDSPSDSVGWWAVHAEKSAARASDHSQNDDHSSAAAEHKLAADDHREAAEQHTGIIWTGSKDRLAREKHLEAARLHDRAAREHEGV